MIQLRITNGFDRLRDGDLIVRGTTILDAMSGNANFPTPTPTMAELTQGIDEFSEAVSAAEEGGIYEKAFKNEKREALITLLHRLGNYVLFTSNGDRLKALSSQFTIAREPEPAPPITKPELFNVIEGMNPGELNVKFKRVKGARSYLVQYAQEPVTDATNWLQHVCTVSKCTLMQLASGKQYRLRVVAVGINSQMAYSDPVSKWVQ